MQYRILGSTGLRVSVVGVGTWQLGGEWGKNFTDHEVRAILARAADLGINLIDTAECYGDHLAEALIGRALADLNLRKKFIIASKFGHKFHGYLERSEPRTPHDVEVQLEESLRALRTDAIDLYQYHSWGKADFDQTGVIEVLLKAQQAGKIRFIGNSISPNTNLYQTERSPQHHVQAIQVVYNRLDRKPEEALLPACQRLNLGVLARVPLASGFLSGKYKPGDRFGETHDYRGTMKPEVIDEKLREADTIARTEVPAGVPMAEWALAWCLQHPAVTCVIPGCKSAAQVESNARAADLPLVRKDHPQAVG